MKAVLIGYQILKFTNEDTGEVVDGIKIHFAYPDDFVVGLRVESKFVSRRVSANFTLDEKQLIAIAENNGEIELDYGPKNKIVDIRQSAQTKDTA